MLGSSLPTLIEPAVTRERLQDIADTPAPSGSELAKRVRAVAIQNARSDLPGQWGMYVGWTVAQGHRSEWLSIGWPRAFADVTTQRVYEDVVARTGWVPCRTYPTARRIGRYESAGELPRVPPRQLLSVYGGSLFIFPPPERTGGALREIHIGLVRLVVPLGLIALAAVVVPRLLRPLIRRIPPERRGGWGRLASPWLAALLMLGVIVAMTVYTAKPRDMVRPTVVGEPNARPSWPLYARRWENFAQVPLSPAELDALIATGDADRMLARTILDLPGTGSGKYLTIAGIREGVQTVAGTRARLFANSLLLFTVSENVYERRPDMGTPGPMTFPAGLSRGGTSRLRWSSGDPSRPVLELSLYNENLVPALLALVGFSLLVQWLSTGMLFRRARRRRSACQCVACGYSVRADPSVKGVSAAPASS